MIPVLCFVFMFVPGIVSQWDNIQVVKTQSYIKATAGKDPLNLTCNYETAQMRFLQIRPLRITWSKVTGGETNAIYTDDVTRSWSRGQFTGSWLSRGLETHKRSYNADIQLPASELDADDSGVYVCDLEDDDGKHYTSNTTVTVNHSPQDITVEGMEQEVIEGQNVTISCFADCIPECNFTWYRDSIDFHGEDKTLSIEEASRNDTGNYTCVAGNEFGSINVTVQLHILYGDGNHIWFHPPTVQLNATEGQPLNLNCFSNCDPECDVNWFKGNISLPTINGVTVFTSINRTDHDVYVCHAGNGDVSDQRQLEVNVHYGPGTSVVFLPNLTQHVINENEALKLECEANCYPSCEFVWLKDGEEISSERTFSIDNFIRQQTGNYSCVASNSIGSSEAVILVNVQYEPSIRRVDINHGANTVDEGDRAVFSCQVDANPAPLMTWTNQNTHTIVQQETSDESDYIIRQAACHHQATYQCSAENGVGEKIDRQIRLYVNCAPREASHGIQQTEVQASRGSVANLSLDVIAYPAPTFTWYRVATFGQYKVNEPRFKVTSTMTSSTLTISDVRLEDYGEYELQVNNSIGNFHQRFQLTRADFPDMSKSFICTNHTFHTVDLQWISQDNNGAAQEFILEYSSPSGQVTNETIPIQDPGRNKTVRVKVTNLEPDTLYSFSQYSRNRFGKSEPIKTTCFTDKHTTLTIDSGPSYYLHGIGTGFALCVCIVIISVGAIYLAKRHCCKHKGDESIKEDPIWRPRFDKMVDNRMSPDWNNYREYREHRGVNLEPLLQDSKLQKNKWAGNMNKLTEV